MITSPIVGVDYVTNASAAVGGANAQTDAQARAGFVVWVGTLSRATVAAVQGVAVAIQSNLFVQVIEGVNPSGATQYGSFYMVVDDGTGTPPGSLISAVSTAVNGARPLGVPWGVIGPTPVSAPVVINVRLAAGYTSASVLAAVQAAILAYINGTGFLATVSYSKLAQVAFDASPGVANVTGITLGGGTADLVATGNQVIRCPSVTISTY